jgi:hypothetical protein
MCFFLFSDEKAQEQQNHTEKEQADKTSEEKGQTL